MEKYYINASQLENMNAGSKAVNDACKIFEKNGYKRLLPQIRVKNKYLQYIITIAISIQAFIRILFLSKKSTVILNFPPIYFFERLSLLILKTRAKSINVIMLIHDIYELREGKDNKTSYRNLLNYKNGNFYYICHNQKMKKWLTKQGYSDEKIVSLDLFDYLSCKNDKNFFNIEKNVIIAGNLTTEKNKFLSKIDQISDIDFNLYGPNLSDEISKKQNIHYFGSFPSDQIQKHLKGSFGLVWDSETLTGGIGKYGDYQKYNNPHKISLYLSSGFPVVIWSKAALASFIVENNLGIVVNDLEQLSKEIKQLSRENYIEMKKNVEDIAEKIREGYFLSTAIKKVELLTNQ